MTAKTSRLPFDLERLTPLHARSRGLTIMAITLVLAGMTALTACSPNSGGVRGHTAFSATVAVTEVDAAVPLAAFAKCFRTRGTFLPLSKFEQDESRFVYPCR